MEEAILEAEGTVEELENLFAEPDFYDKHGHEIDELTQKLNDAKDVVTGLYSRWEELEEKQAELAGN